MYASRTGTRRNLAVMRECGWRLLVNATGVWRNEGFPYAIDNGAWTAHQHGKPFDGARFSGLVAAMGRDADWIVLPDVVENSLATAAITEEWVDRLVGFRLLAAIQDGAESRVLDRLVDHVHGFFLGGSTGYKLDSMDRWGAWCRERDKHFHVGRVNTPRRIRACAWAGADSCDGTSASMFSKSTARLTFANRQVSITELLMKRGGRVDD